MFPRCTECVFSYTSGLFTVFASKEETGEHGGAFSRERVCVVLSIIGFLSAQGCWMLPTTLEGSKTMTLKSRSTSCMKFLAILRFPIYYFYLSDCYINQVTSGGEVYKHAERGL